MPPAGSCFSLHQLQMPAPPGPCLLNPPTACALPGPGSPLSYLPPPLNSVSLVQPSQTTSELTTSGSPSSPALTRSPLFSDLTHSVPSRLQLHFLTQSPLQVCPPILHPTSPLAPPPLSQSFSSSCPLCLLGIPRPSSHSATSCARDPLALHRPGPTGSVSRPPCCPAARRPRSPPLRPRPACRRRTCSCCSSRGHLPAPSHSGAHSRPASRAYVCLRAGLRAPTHAWWGWEAAGGGLQRANADSAARGCQIGSRAEDWGGPGHKPRPQRILVPPSPAAILSQSRALSSSGKVFFRRSFCEILLVWLSSSWSPDFCFPKSAVGSYLSLTQHLIPGERGSERLIQS